MPDTPLFDRPVDRICRRLTFSVDDQLAQYYDRPRLGREVLMHLIRAFSADLETHRHHSEFMDIGLASKLAVQAESLIEILPETDETTHRLVQMAVLYLVETDDAENDIESPIGFDDDAEVIGAVAKEIGREDILNIEEDTK